MVSQLSYGGGALKSLEEFDITVTGCIESGEFPSLYGLDDFIELCSSLTKPVYTIPLYP